MDGQQIKQIAVFVTIPFVLAIPPILGWFIGQWLDKLLGLGPILMYTFLALGFIAGFREMFRLIKRYGNGT